VKKTNRNGSKPAQCGGVGGSPSLALPVILVSLLTLAPLSSGCWSGVQCRGRCAHSGCSTIAAGVPILRDLLHRRTPIRGFGNDRSMSKQAHALAAVNYQKKAVQKKRGHGAR
jgi:hypothetical protein